MNWTFLMLLPFFFSVLVAMRTEIRFSLWLWACNWLVKCLKMEKKLNVHWAPLLCTVKWLALYSSGNSMSWFEFTFLSLFIHFKRIRLLQIMQRFLFNKPLPQQPYDFFRSLSPSLDVLFVVANLRCTSFRSIYFESVRVDFDSNW